MRKVHASFALRLHLHCIISLCSVIGIGENGIQTFFQTADLPEAVAPGTYRFQTPADAAKT